MRVQLAKETRQSPVGGKVQWPRVLVFENFPEGITISEYDRIRILTLRVRWKEPRVGRIWSQIEKLDVPWRMSMATTRRGTFTCSAHNRPFGRIMLTDMNVNDCDMSMLNANSQTGTWSRCTYHF